jgi:hypothetical protein
MHRLANIIRLTLLALLLVTPWLFGGVWARVQWILMLVGAMLLAADLVTRFDEDDRPNLIPAAWLPVLAGVVLGLFQLVPWPPALAQVLAPSTVQWRAEFAAAEPAERSAAETPAARGTGRVTRSVYAVATREYLALLTLALAIFVLASVHMVDRQTVRWFFAAVGGCGAALSFFGLVQRLSWNGKFYWVFEPLEGSVQSFGPFVNRNNAGGFLNLCLAAGLGLLVWVHQGASTGGRGSSSSRGSRRRYGHERRSSRGSRREGSGRRRDDRPPRASHRDDWTGAADASSPPAPGSNPPRSPGPNPKRHGRPAEIRPIRSRATHRQTTCPSRPDPRRCGRIGGKGIAAGRRVPIGGAATVRIPPTRPPRIPPHMPARTWADRHEIPTAACATRCRIISRT